MAGTACEFIGTKKTTKQKKLSITSSDLNNKSGNDAISNLDINLAFISLSLILLYTCFYSCFYGYNPPNIGRLSLQHRPDSGQHNNN
jgi:hypothetical protein